MSRAVKKKAEFMGKISFLTFDSLWDTFKIRRQHLGSGVRQLHHLSELLRRR